MPKRARVTIAEVAAAAGVSLGAASYALNGKRGVGEATRERVLQVADDLGYSASSSARALSQSRAHTLGMVLRRTPEALGAEPFFPLFSAGVEQALARRGYGLMLQVAADEEAERQAYRRLASSGRVDGVFLLDLRQREPRFAWTVDHDLPALAVGRPFGTVDIPWLGVDDRAGVHETVAHLVELGHRHLAYVAGAPGYVHTASRRRAWRRALADADVPIGPMLPSDFTGGSGAAATRKLLAMTPRPTAIAYANDFMAIAGMGVLQHAGLSIPADISVVGFDDVPVAAHLTPALSSVATDVTAWGSAAADSLVALIEGGEPRTGWLEPSRLVARESSGPAPALPTSP